MTGRRYKIVESVGNRIEDVFRYEDLAKHHPSSGREPNRDYETINGQLEEVRYVGGRTLIKKDFVLLVDGSNQSIPVPSPLAGYARTDRSYGTLQIYDSPSNGQLLGQILHLHPTFKVNDGDAVTYGQHVGLQAGTDRVGGQRYAIHVHAELEESAFKRYIADIVDGTLHPNDKTPKTAVNGSEDAAIGDWCYPCKPLAGHPLQPLAALCKAQAGFYPIGGNGLWHGGIHFDEGTSGAFDQSRVNCITHGEVIAYRIDDEYPLSTYAGNLPLQIRAPFSTGFVLVKHTLQAKVSNTEDHANPPALTIFSLYMHLKCWKEYRQDEKLERPSFWASGVYTVSTGSGELNVRAEARMNSAVVGKLSKGAQIRASGEGVFLKLEQVISGNNEPALTPQVDGSMPGYVSSSFLTAQSKPQALDSVVLLDPPVPIKTGGLIGHLGKYQNQSHNSPHELLHLEVFSCEDVPAFISECRKWAKNLPDEKKSLLKIHAGASKLIPHREDINSENPPNQNEEGSEIGVDLILPQSLLDALPTEAKIKTPTSNKTTGYSPKTIWWRLDDLLADKNGRPVSGWLLEQDLITTRHSPWEWEGFDFLEDTDTPSSGLAYYLNSARRLSADEKARYQAAIDQSDKGPVRSRLYDIIDTNRDGKMTSAEIQAALEKPWHAQSISQLITRHESEWFWNATRWDELDELMGHSPDDPNLDWVTEKLRIKALSWWTVLAGQHGINSDGLAWHFHPMALINPDPADLGELRVRAFLRMVRVGEGTEGDTGYEKLFGGSSFIRDYGKTFSDHPQIKIKKSGYTSSAAGAYQVMGYTWTDKSVMKFRNRLNIHDFTPESQDKFCVALLKFKVRGETLDLVIAGKTREAIENSSWEWASLPPGRYSQPIETMDDAIANYDKFLEEELEGITDLHLKKGFLKEFGY
ncbi:glycoside hydrolase family 104 protein [Stutzerimonas zhaodongensis]|uniref:glycoside hydrolase family 104 protein n=1 Tax=Stutzerimonas zhaodongensis TaxID=1176257 RepID=UPI001FC9E72F|nr:glycoside hydrolase family 104 protein [Stutzerimonas zhaodongensis]MCQ4317981.1 glycoside hydrolase family 104 protein [Stutzerimonas zhaodongensis]